MICIILLYGLSEDFLFICAFTALYSVPIPPTAAEIWALEECNVIPIHYCIGIICAVSGSSGIGCVYEIWDWNILSFLMGYVIGRDPHPM